MIDVTDLTKVYRRGTREVHALSGVSLHIDRGDFAVVEGPSGSGKTTLLFAVAGLIRPSSGKVTVDGTDLTGRSPAELAALRGKTFGFVFQMFHLIPYLTALENVCVPMGLAGVAPAEATKRAADLLGRFSLSDRGEHYPSELSAGEKQRVAIARAVANRPPVVLADEPTGNLDARAAVDVLDAFTEINSEDTTILVVTHDDRLRGHASRRFTLEAGQLTEEHLRSAE